MSGILGSMFDLDRDGDLNYFERAMEFAFLEEVISEEEKDSLWDEDSNDYY